MRCELLRRVRYSVVGLTDVRLFVWQAQRGIACRCLSACLPRESRLARACVRARTHAESPPGRACWLLGTHVAVDDSDPVLASPRLLSL